MNVLSESPPTLTKDSEMHAEDRNDGFSSPAAALPPPRTDFETAIKACGFGLFNIYLLAISTFAIATTFFEISTMSYVLPTAECDLQLTLMDKGVISAVTYAGMIISAVPWGYVADTMGRKKVLVYGLLLDSVLALCTALSRNFAQILIFKFLGGFVVSGPFAVIMSYLSEFHSKEHRSRIMMITGMMKSSAFLVLPVLAFAILPLDWQFQLFDVQFHIWQIFIVITAMPGFLSGFVIACCFPESPQFLMTQGRYEEALSTFQYIYALNKRQPRHTFPLTNLVSEIAEARTNIKDPSGSTGRQQGQDAAVQSVTTSFRNGIQQLKPLFTRPFLGLSLLVYIIDLCILMGQNTIRFWLPQIFASMAEYEDKGLGASSMCAILAYNVNRTRLLREVEEQLPQCDVHITPASYVNNIIVAVAGFVGAFAVSFVVNRIGNKNLLSGGLALCCVCGFSLYWSTTSLTTLVLSSVFVTISGICATAVISTSVNIFPTTMRTMVVILIMTFGRFGSLSGNILFPLFVSMGCILPFLLVGGVTLCACIISFFLPNTAAS